MTQSGNWATLIELPILEDVYEDDEELEEILKKFHEVLYKTEKAEFTIPGEKLCIKGLDETLGIFKTRYKYAGE